MSEKHFGRYDPVNDHSLEKQFFEILKNRQMWPKMFSEGIFAVLEGVHF